MIKLIMGGAGTGKSTLLKQYKSENEATLTIAPTGVAALLIGGETAHRAFKLPISLIGENDIIASPLRNKWNGIRTLIMDEAFMLRADVFNAIDISMRKNRGNIYEPFGGCEVMIFGDPFQLPPILNDKDKPVFSSMGYKSEWMFDLPVIEEAEIEVLTKCYRQDDEAFVKSLNQIRTGHITPETLDIINSRVGKKIDEPFITLTAKNVDVDRVNMERFDAIQGKAQSWDAYIQGDFPAKDCLSPVELHLKVGCQVMMTKNDMANRWVNGTLATVVKLGRHTVDVDIKGKIHTVEKETWEKMEGSYDASTKKTKPKVVGSFTQLPIKLAYATTIHKCQGMTLSNGFVELNGRLTTAGQMYVTLSRFTSLEAFSLSRPVTMFDVVVNERVKEWYERVAA